MNIGLVLSGGMAKGAYQIGALEALHSFIPSEEIQYISCASVGVLNGYAYATQKFDMVKDMWKHICTDDDTRIIISKMLRSSMLQRNIIDIHSETDVLPTKFYCSLLDTTHKKMVYKNLSAEENSTLPQYLKASVAMPVYNRAVTINNVSYYDGAMIDNIPVFPLMKHILDYIICIYFDDPTTMFENEVFDSKVIKITFPSDSILKQSVVFKQSSIEDMIEKGYNRTNDILNFVFRNGYEDVESVYDAIRIKNSTTVPKFRVTGDVMVSNLNKVTKRFAKRRIDT